MEADREYLLSLQSVRDHAGKVLRAAKRNELNHFDFDASRITTVADYVTKLIERDFGPDKFDTIPPHGRWQHFDIGGVGRVDSLLTSWRDELQVDKTEHTRRLLDLFFVSVLLDAGAGDVWRFREQDTGQEIGRSEGIAVASLHMFTAGAFSSSSDSKQQVDGEALVNLKEETFNKYFQISDSNPMVGVSSRVELLQAVGRSLLKSKDIFGEAGRPGQLVDYLTKDVQPKARLDFKKLWHCLQTVLIPSWPAGRPTFHGSPIGDAWPLAVLASESQKDGETSEKSKIQPFHKLTQWLAYSLTVPFNRVLGFEWMDLELGTGLPEYRNGGLFVDLGALKLKQADVEAGKARSGQELPQFEASDDVVVEWRAMTVALLDELHGVVSERFKSKGITLSLPQMLEAGTWKAGRELAAAERPSTKSSPILVISDGTLY